jgi:hypothetical protein
MSRLATNVTCSRLRPNDFSRYYHPFSSSRSWFLRHAHRFIFALGWPSYPLSLLYIMCPFTSLSASIHASLSSHIIHPNIIRISGIAAPRWRIECQECSGPSDRRVSFEICCEWLLDLRTTCFVQTSQLHKDVTTCVRHHSSV